MSQNEVTFCRPELLSMHEGHREGGGVLGIRSEQESAKYQVVARVETLKIESFVLSQLSELPFL